MKTKKENYKIKNKTKKVKNKTKTKKTKKTKNKKSFLFPLSKKLREGYVKVSNIHEIYFSTYGNPKGKPVLVVHGGPGAGTTPKMSRFFDPKSYYVVLVDQRGCGKSRPFGEIKDNTTQDLINDFEKIRKHLDNLIDDKKSMEKKEK